MKLRDSFHPYACVTILFWSLAFVVTRLALEYFTSFSLGFLRYFTAACAMIVIVLVLKVKAPKAADLKRFLASGFFGFFVCMVAFNKGLETATAATGSVILAVAPVVTALLARVFYKEKLGAVKWAATAIEFSGVAVLALMNNAFSFNPGIFLLLLAAVSMGTYNLFQRKLTKTYSGLQASSYSIFAGAVMLAVFSPVSIKEAAAAPPAGLLCVFILGVFSGAIAFASWAQAFKKAKQTSSVSNYMFVTPFLTALLGFLLAGELPDLPTAVGGAIVLTGMLVFNFGDRIRARVSSKRLTCRKAAENAGQV